MSVKYIYNIGTYMPQYEAVINRLWESFTSMLDLPREIVVVFENLGKSVYADTKVDPRFKNRVTINAELMVRDVPGAFTHEIIHVHQIHTGLLRADHHGNMFWRDRIYKIDDNLTYEQYCELPWEADVLVRHQSLLNEVLKLAMSKLENK
jgi:hypothetical protein